uniref:Uncharacterized protein n=1 Tax=Chromera velia CCMP2878 TaxID=1169474 RepID=A0A0G4IDN6_9ALVE|eukprot:Cvel_13358.t1-p1 / transcript=Cvel_13358.t1 / gene=Cvel_13358 / organism=Chromera_velia_CCMP2878 / gene_product=hypothetical protein / transcript_product=hypothetical protein / location=Cvel_scaffold908:2025-2333(-) / protein_length=103 / sequence_SO=supercontig / SO=protein_coding / is_pseudo=false
MSGWMQGKHKKLMDYNAIREKHSEKMFADNKCLTWFGVGLDKDGVPALQIGTEPGTDTSQLVIPDEIKEGAANGSIHLEYQTVNRPTDLLPRLTPVEGIEPAE